jgi:hypothetical protein
MLYEFGSGDKEELRSEAWEERKWINIVSELRTGGKLSIGRPFFCFFSSLLFFVLYYFIGSRPGIHGVGTGFDNSGSQSMGSGGSPCAGCTERLPYSANR